MPRYAYWMCPEALPGCSPQFPERITSYLAGRGMANGFISLPNAAVDRFSYGRFHLRAGFQSRSQRQAVWQRPSRPMDSSFITPNMKPQGYGECPCPGGRRNVFWTNPRGMTGVKEEDKFSVNRDWGSARLLAACRESTHVCDREPEILVRIYRSVVDADFVVEMGTGAASALADVSDGVSAVHMLA